VILPPVCGIDVDLNNLEQIRTCVQLNCHIADARHGSSYGLCTYLMKMREYFRWEQGLGFSDSLDKDEVGEWLSAREELWSELEEQDFVTVTVDGNEHDPFDTTAINTALADYDLVYSGGIGHSGRPHFFLGELIYRSDSPDYSLVVTGRELARDLTAPPAMTREDVIFVRRESLRRMLWEKLESWRWSRPDNPLGKAFSCYPFEHDLDGALEQMTDSELDLVMLHEKGECLAGELLGERWNEMLLEFTETPAELVARAVRDHLADCLVTLKRLAETERPASVHFFIGNLSSMRKTLFPGLRQAYEHWLESGDLDSIGEIALRGTDHWQKVAYEILDLQAKQGEGAVTAICRFAEERCL